MKISPKARMNRLFTNGGCLDVAIDHGVCNEPSFMVGLEDMPRVVDALIRAKPDAIQMAYGQADLLQSRPEKEKPALVMRLDMGNPYNATRHRVMWSMLQNADEPIIGALEMVNISAPIVIRLDGTNAEEGRALLAPHLSDKLVSKPTMLEAAAAAVELAKKN